MGAGGVGHAHTGNNQSVQGTGSQVGHIQSKAGPPAGPTGRKAGRNMFWGRELGMGTGARNTIVWL